MKISSAEVKPLSEVLEYENQNVINRFLNFFTVSEEEAQMIFNETKKWLWLCGKSFEEGVNDIYISKDLIIIDEMWHTFLLFSLDYYNFCNSYFNTIVHHIPVTESDFPNDDNTSRQDKIKFLKQKEDNFFNYVYEKLGNETLNLWFLELPQKYSKENVNTLFRGIYPQKK